MAEIWHPSQSQKIPLCLEGSVMLSPNASPVVLVEGQVAQQRPCPASSRAKAAAGPLGFCCGFCDSVYYANPDKAINLCLGCENPINQSFINEMANDGQEEQRHFMVVQISLQKRRILKKINDINKGTPLRLAAFGGAWIRYPNFEMRDLACGETLAMLAWKASLFF
ncbi:hypothetical protein L345_07448, partial [Ophiophagus hannah]